MFEITFDHNEIKEEYSEYKVRLYVKPNLDYYKTEFASELGTIEKRINRTQNKSSKFCEEKFA